MMNIDCLLQLKFDEYHFAIEPEKLMNTSFDKQETDESNVRYELKLVKGEQNFGKIKQSIKLHNGEVTFSKRPLLYFYLSSKPRRNVIFQLLLIKIGSEVRKIGSIPLMSGKYIESFEKTGSRFLTDTKDFNNDYFLKFNVYVGKSKNDIENFLQENKHENKEEKIQQTKLQIKSRLRNKQSQGKEQNVFQQNSTVKQTEDILSMEGLSEAYQQFLELNKENEEVLPQITPQFRRTNSEIFDAKGTKIFQHHEGNQSIPSNIYVKSTYSKSLHHFIAGAFIFTVLIMFFMMIFGL